MGKLGSWVGLFFAVVFFNSFLVHADVTGSFDLNILALPEPPQSFSSQFEDINRFEAIKMLFDIRSNLQVNITVSGLTLGFDFGFGTTGIEFGILNLFTSLGGFTLSDQFVFATPFYRSGLLTSVTQSPSVSFGFNGSQIHPTMNSDGVINGPAFVKKRVNVSSNIAGASISVLAIFEDVDFPNPFLTTDPVYNIGQVDSIIGNQTPTYGFGTLVQLSGQTVSGIRVNSRTGICISQRSNIIKGRAWPDSVNPACTASIGNNLDDPIENGAKTPLLFDFHNISIRDLFLGEVRLSFDATWKPDTGMEGGIQADIELFDFLDTRVAVSFEDLMNLKIRSIITRLVSDNFRLTFVDRDGDFDIETLVAVFSFVLNPNQNPASFTSSTVLTEASGFAGQSFRLLIRRGLFSFITSTNFSATPDPNDNGLTWSGSFFGASFRPSQDSTSPIIDAVVGYSPSGTTGFEISFGFSF